MKRVPTPNVFHTALCTLLLGCSVQAAGLINNFDVPYDYVLNGIVGDTNWDGIYLRFGDIQNGAVGGNPAGNTAIANSSITYAGYLSLRSSGGDWAGTGDDGVFLWKLVAGDFDVSVQSSPFTLNGGIGYDNGAYQMAGLMARAYNPDNSGAPYSTTITNQAENYVMLLRFQEFNINEVNEATNGVRVERTFPDDNTDTNSTRYFRMVRTSLTNFTFYWKTNLADSWAQITNHLPPGGVLVRSDLTGPLQVGIAQSPFSAGTHDAVFTDFELTGTNVSFPAMPAGPSGLVTTATNTSGALTFSWTKGAPADSSLVIIRANGNIQGSPIQGVVYNADSVFKDPATLLSVGGQYVVYNGPANSVTVTNMGANNITYSVAVYDYANPASPVYNTASPAIGSFVGPGVITSAALAPPVNNIPVNGAVAVKLIASFSTGETSDQTAATLWSTSDPTILNINALGVASGIAPGTATITGTFGPFVVTTNITVHAALLTDTFAVTNNYITNGLIGTMYDGLFMKFGDVPGGAAGGDGPGSTLIFDSQLTDTNGLYISSVQSTWAGSADDGPFLYKLVPGSINGVSGDFEALVHINSMNTLNGVAAGIMARLFNPANHGPGPNAQENHVNYWKVQNGLTWVRRTQAGGNLTFVATGPAAADGWLLLQRVNSTNFYFFEKSLATDLWTLVTNLVLVTATNNAPMEVGLAQQSTAGVNGITTFDSFMLDAQGIVSGTPPPAPASNVVMALNADLSMTISYNVGTNADGTAIRSIVVMRDGGPVSAQPYTGMGLAGNSLFGDPNNSLGDGNYVVYRSPSGSTNTAQSVTVTGLTPGHTYYAAVYTFVGLGPTRTFNEDATTSHGTLQDGTLLYLEILPTPSIPAGGMGTMQVFGHYTGGAVVNVSPFATIITDNTNIIKVQSGILTGISNGIANITLVFSGVTNSQAVTVRSPSFVDTFSTSHDYLANGVAGTPYQGMYVTMGTNPVPDSPYVPIAGNSTTVADANITSNGVFTITGTGDGWENDLSGGFFLFRYVPGDFQMAVQIHAFDINNYNQPGLLARAYSVGSGLQIGAPFGEFWPNDFGTNDLGEYWVSFTRFDEFNIGTYARRNIDSGVSQNTQTDPGPGAINGPTGTDTNYWLLVVRSKGSEFDFYKRASLTDTWKQVPNKTHYSLAEFAGQPMQVGIMAGPWTDGIAARSVQFANFMLDSTTGSPLSITLAGGNVTLSWPAIPATVQHTTTLSPPNWQAVGGTPVLGPTGYSLTIPAGTTGFFRLVQ